MLELSLHIFYIIEKEIIKQRCKEKWEILISAGKTSNLGVYIRWVGNYRVL